jgi:hypothetical protein
MSKKNRKLRKVLDKNSNNTLKKRFDFTVSVLPDNNNLDKDLRYIKSALLYADRVKLISPLAYLIVQLTDQNNSLNEKTVISLIKKIMPLVKLCDIDFYNENSQIIEQFSKLISSNKYRALPMSYIMDIRRELKAFSLAIHDTLFKLIGNNQCTELGTLVKSGQVIIDKFDSSIDNVFLYGLEFFEKLRTSLSHSYPLFDEDSNNLMSSVLDTHIIHLTEIEKQKIAHAGLADNYIQRLPSFELTPISELIDVKKALGNHVIRFRSKMLEYSAQIQSLPWDKDFVIECQILFDKEVAPAILEIEEATKDNSFRKNISNQFLNDDNIWKTAGGLAVSIAASGVIKTLTQVAASDIAGFLTISTLSIPVSIIGQKLYKAYSEYNEKNKEIEQNDLFFYYKAGKLIDR